MDEWLADHRVQQLLYDRDRLRAALEVAMNARQCTRCGLMTPKAADKCVWCSALAGAGETKPEEHSNG